ncbi:hypothetical protein CY34DRAFT_804015 [Suillus luteus UH-Slu-Lm8-n1]|uniref:Uncharacterized protein n=1 Tax=Suillus luteus UH-Slu-Lm8-n1 TaxID=930992 RepID=A0A0D0AZR7_9AGAM|nr:hypothetical protein CY34DRAFT_804015 [Suillus luteus UH-Slu-Lm8-n1]
MRSCSASKTTKARESNREISECPSYVLGRRDEVEDRLCFESRDNNIAFNDAIGNGEERVAELHSRCGYSELVGDMWALNTVLCDRRHRITSLHMPQIYSRRNMSSSSNNTAWEVRRYKHLLSAMSAESLTRRF